MGGRLGNTLTAYGYAKRKRDRFERILASDPFAEQQLARNEVTEFEATRLAPELNLPIPA
jgi:hypothetical protein